MERHELWTRLAGWLTGIPPDRAPAGDAAPAARQARREKAAAAGQWTLTVRPPMTRPEHVTEPVYEWGLHVFKPGTDRVCRITGIWFLATKRTTIDARETIEALRHSTPLTVRQLRRLIDSHRAEGTAVHLSRRFGEASAIETFDSADDPGFTEALAWGGMSDPDGE